MLTIEKLKTLQPHTIFTFGVATDNDFGVNMNNSGVALRWVACTGGIGDWAIYCGCEGESNEHIQASGDKVHMTEHIRHLVSCDDASFAQYRH